ncbi:hypothetical protein L1987_49571 [Smallanthus sonchifolius]|uniref:Uncharacterized protein n=1 Tax=Smallanthus sonchifolius TaxID=185202 RepID=A0ACB9FVN9_9ASTR|nr:hypothetical protein L1987_49571 [Smallanthus sonchifolius]
MKNSDLPWRLSFQNSRAFSSSRSWLKPRFDNYRFRGFRDTPSLMVRVFTANSSDYAILAGLSLGAPLQKVLVLH